MIGIAILTHGDMGVAMLATAESILGKQEQMAALSLPPRLGREDLVAALNHAIPGLDSGDGILVLVDMLGGTPCNAALECLDPKRAILAGVSLPVLMEALLKRQSLPLLELAAHVRDRGKDSLVWVDQDLKKGK